VASDGRILFKEQIYRTAVVVVDTPGGRPRQIMGPQAETPSWDPTGKWLGVTYGTWRRYVDDYQYPDIAQDAGIVAADSGELKTKPDRIVDDSPSEDQGIGWSPNNRWIAYHSHKDNSDDIWLRPADLSRSGVRLTHLGRGAESGWPRWSPDGRWIVFGANGRGPRERWVTYRIPANQETGETKPEEEVVIDAPFGAVAAEWLSPTSIVIDGFTPPDEHTLAVVDIRGGKPRSLHAYRNRQYYPGLGASPDGRWVFFAAPAPDGFMQIFRIAAAGGPVEQITHDPFDKTQPAASVTGRLAYTVWEYRMEFWTLTLR
jgi:Tol biopolymer transport system component